MAQTLDSYANLETGHITKTVSNDLKRSSRLKWVTCLIGVALLSGCASGKHQKSRHATVLTDPPLTQSPVPTPTAHSQETGTFIPQPLEPITMAANAPDQYTVKKGDTLWDISARFLADPWFWPEIWQVNPEIKNPHLIYPGDVISLYYVNGQPRLSINQPMVSDGDGRISPRVRNSELTAENSGIPIEAIRPFLIRPQIVSEEQLRLAAHILDSDENRLIFGSYGKVYVRNLEDSRVNSKYSVFRPGEKLIDPVSKELLGFEAIYAGDAVVEVDGEPATVKLVNTTREILRGDRLLPQDHGATGIHFWPHPANASTNGQIISIFDALSQVAQYQIIAINLGKRDAVEPGHVFAVKQKGRTIKDRHHHRDQSKQVKLPDERTGIAMVFRTFEKISYALIMKSTRTIREGDLVSSP